VKRVRLGELKPGDRARIVGVAAGKDLAGESAPRFDDLVARLMEMGLLEGSPVELMHQAPFGGDPIAVRVRGALIALRRGEANLIWVETP
jgi:ferrous iron transport protein A